MGILGEIDTSRHSEDTRFEAGQRDFLNTWTPHRSNNRTQLHAYVPAPASWNLDSMAPLLLAAAIVGFLLTQ